MTATATIVVDLGFGDAGKGSIVDALIRRRKSGGVVRFNGGCQAGHNVADGGESVFREHIFAQFGAGTLAGARTHLSRFMMVEPMSLFNEAEHLVQIGVDAPTSLMTVDPRALVTTPLHKFANQEKERRRGASPHGSCGRGIGETVEFSLQRPLDALRVADLWKPDVLLNKLAALDSYYRFDQKLELDWDWKPMWEEAVAHFRDEIRTEYDAAILSRWRQQMGHIVFEGAQGVLIDERHGFAPYHTWSNCTFNNAMELLAEAGFRRDEFSKVGVTRGYMVRHGAGPLPTEDDYLSQVLADRWNETNPWQGRFRVGHLDLVLLRYAVECCGGIDELAVTNLDRVEYLTTPARTHLGKAASFNLNGIGAAYTDKDVDVYSEMPPPYPVQVCTQYRHKQWGLFDTPVARLPMRPSTYAEILGEMEPIYQPWPDDFPYWISQELKTPTTILSYGPFAKDKRWLTYDGVTDAGVLSRRA